MSKFTYVDLLRKMRKSSQTLCQERRHETIFMQDEEYPAVNVAAVLCDEHDAHDHRLFVTGKNWPKLFEIRPVKR